MTAQSTPKFAGETMNLGGTDFVIPPLSLGSLELFQERMASFKGGLDATSIKLTIDLTHAALQRNYPAITRQEVGDVIDISNVEQVMSCVMKVAGLMSTQGEAGKDQAARG